MRLDAWRRQQAKKSCQTHAWTIFSLFSFLLPRGISFKRVQRRANCYVLIRFVLIHRSKCEAAAIVAESIVRLIRLSVDSISSI